MNMCYFYNHEILEIKEVELTSKIRMYKRTSEWDSEEIPLLRVRGPGI